MNTRAKAYIALLLNVAIWGAALPLVKPALAHISPYQYLFYRYLVAVPISIPFLIAMLIKYKPSLKVIAKISVMEIIGVAGYLSFLYEGLSRTTSLEATLIANTASIFIILGGIFFLKEKEERNEFTGLMLAVTGAVMLTVEPIISGRTHAGTSSLIGNVFVLIANLFWASYVLLAKRRYKHTPKLLVGFISPWIGLIFFFVMVLITTPQLSLTSLPEMIFADFARFEVLRAVLYMSLLGSIVAVPAYIYGNSKIEASEASLFAYLQPVIAIPLATIWLKEPINLMMVAALMLTSSGVYIAQRRKNSRNSP